MIAGHTSSYGSGSYDVWLLKMDLATGFAAPNIDSNPTIRIYPNPGNSKITIDFRISYETKIYISIYDLSGKIIRELENACYSPGEYTITWDGTDSIGDTVSAGTYICNIKTGQGCLSEKIIIW